MRTIRISPVVTPTIQRTGLVRVPPCAVPRLLRLVLVYNDVRTACFQGRCIDPNAPYESLQAYPRSWLRFFTASVSACDWTIDQLTEVFGRDVCEEIIGSVRSLIQLNSISSNPLLVNLKAYQLGQIAERAVRVRVKGGEWVFHQEDEGSDMFIVKGGSLVMVDEGSPECPGDGVRALSSQRHR